MIVRKAERGDLLGIGRVAEEAHWTSYAGLLRLDTIGRLILREFSPSVLARRLLRGGLFVADAAGDIIGFSDEGAETGRMQLRAVCTLPEQRRRGVGTGLLVAARGRAPSLAMAADVLLGNFEGERFCEANGFVPGEVSHRTLFDEDIVERRWWLEPAASQTAERERAASG